MTDLERCRLEILLAQQALASATCEADRKIFTLWRNDWLIEECLLVEKGEKKC